MRIERHYARKVDLAEFAEKHDLTMVIRERDDPKLPRFFATFKNVDVKEGAVLVGLYGDGATEDAAISDYATEISNKIITVYGCGDGERKNIICPSLEYAVAKG